MRAAAVVAVVISLGLACVAVIFPSAADVPRVMVSVMEHRQRLAEKGHIALDIAFIDPTHVEHIGVDADSLRPVPQYPPGEAVWLRIRITNESSEELMLLEPFFVSDEKPPALIIWYPGMDADPRTPAANRPHTLKDRFTRWPFLTEFGRSEAVQRREHPQRTELSPGASVVREVCFSNLYDISAPWRYYQVLNPAIELEMTSGETIAIGGDYWCFQVTGPKTTGKRDTVDASIVSE